MGCCSSLLKDDKPQQNAAPAKPPQTQAAAAAAAPSGSASGALANAFVAAHNKVRAQHGAHPMTYHAGAAIHAQQQAELCLKKGAMEHGNCSEFKEGQNLFVATWSGYGGRADDDYIQQAVDSWYAEIKDYKAAGGGLKGYEAGAGHFTQVVWKASTSVGLGFARKDGMVIVCGNYSPGGNVWDEAQFKQNVQA